jgi:hypothetical protein
VIYNFFFFLQASLGEEREINERLSERAPVKHMFPFSCCLRPYVHVHLVFSPSLIVFVRVSLFIFFNINIVGVWMVNSYHDVNMVYYHILLLKFC